ncbi:MAG TPA: hypothetical protein VM008_05200 [Phycisphaerae bacterium]|nr:hypothetical protein [Phycisphaerae bacterium]
MPTPRPYSPHDASITLPALQFLHSPPGEQLRAHIADLLATHPSPTVADIAALRKSHPPDVVHAALTLGQAQKKAHAKFPQLPYLWAVPEALEQATDAAVAAHKATRFAALNPSNILDLCAGIGGDTMALAKIAPVTAPVIAYDLSPIRTTCLRYNLNSLELQAEIRTKDVRTLLSASKTDNPYNSDRNWGEIANDVHTLAISPPSALFHIDPARRSGGKRSPHFEDLIPGPDILLPLIEQFSGGAIKLSPAVDFDSLPAGHLEVISHDRSVVQAVLWTGKLAETFPPHTRTATIISPHHPPFSHTAQTGRSPSIPAAPGHFAYLFEVDPALTRAGLAGTFAESLGLLPLTIDGGYAAGMDAQHHVALTPFRIIMTLPYSQERVAAALSHLTEGEHGAVEVKTRGGLPGIDTDRLQLIWSAATPTRRTVLIYRQGNDVVATIADRV